MEVEKSLEGKLKDMGFTYKVLPVKIPFLTRVAELFGKEKVSRTKVQDDWLVDTINGKLVEVYSIDIWYTQLRIDGVVVFDARRFKDEELLSLIPIAE